MPSAFTTALPCAAPAPPPPIAAPRTAERQGQRPWRQCLEQQCSSRDRFAALLGVRFLEGWPWHGSPAVLDSVTLYPFTRACFDLATHESLAVPHNVAWQRGRLL